VRVTLKVSPQNPEEFVIVEITETTPLEEMGASNTNALPHSTFLEFAQMSVGICVLTASVAQLVTVLHWPVTRTQYVAASDAPTPVMTRHEVLEEEVI
jgi:hypothetical protein